MASATWFLELLLSSAQCLVARSCHQCVATHVKPDLLLPTHVFLQRERHRRAFAEASLLCAHKERHRSAPHRTMNRTWACRSERERVGVSCLESNVNVTCETILLLDWNIGSCSSRQDHGVLQVEAQIEGCNVPCGLW